MKDDLIIKLYLERNEQAVKETEKKYSTLCKTVIGKLLNNKEDIEECLVDVYMELWKSIPLNPPKNLKYYVVKVSRNLACNRLRYNTAAKRSDEYVVVIEELDSCIDEAYISNINYSDERLSEILDSFIREQKYIDRYIFMRRYWHQDSINEIAEKINGTPNMVKTRLFRVRKALKKYLISHGYVRSRYLQKCIEVEG